jgi:hypothetical protein
LPENDKSSIDLSTDLGLKLRGIAFPSAESMPAFTVTIVYFFFIFLMRCFLTAIHQWTLSISEHDTSFAPISDQNSMPCAEGTAGSSRT